MANLQSKLNGILTLRGLAAETREGNQRDAFKEVAQYIEDLEARVEALEKQLEEAARI